MSISIDELYKKIIKEMGAEKALMKLLEGTVFNYETVKYNNGQEIHPIMLITMASIEMGWEIAIPNNDENEDVIGMTIGIEKYLNDVIDINENSESKGLYPNNIDYAFGTKRGYCPKCKQFLTTDHLFCYKCGIKLNWKWNYEKMENE